MKSPKTILKGLAKYEFYDVSKKDFFERSRCPRWIFSEKLIARKLRN